MTTDPKPEQPPLDEKTQAFVNDVEAVFLKHKKRMIPIIVKVPTKGGYWVDSPDLTIVDYIEEKTPPIVVPDPIKIIT